MGTSELWPAKPSTEPEHPPRTAKQPPAPKLRSRVSVGLNTTRTSLMTVLRVEILSPIHDTPSLHHTTFRLSRRVQLLPITYEQASRLVPNLAPRVTDLEAFGKLSGLRRNRCVKDRGGIFLSMRFHEPIMEHFVVHIACPHGTFNNIGASAWSIASAGGETHGVHSRHQLP